MEQNLIPSGASGLMNHDAHENKHIREGWNITLKLYYFYWIVKFIYLNIKLKY